MIKCLSLLQLTSHRLQQQNDASIAVNRKLVNNFWRILQQLLSSRSAATSERWLSLLSLIDALKKCDFMRLIIVYRILICLILSFAQIEGFLRSVFACVTKVFGAWPSSGGLCPSRPQRRTASIQLCPAVSLSETRIFQHWTYCS